MKAYRECDDRFELIGEKIDITGESIIGHSKIIETVIKKRTYDPLSEILEEPWKGH